MKLTTDKAVEVVRIAANDKNFTRQETKFYICQLYDIGMINANQYLYLQEITEKGEFDVRLIEVVVQENKLENPVTCVSIYFNDGEHVLVDDLEGDFLESLSDKPVKGFNREMDGTLNIVVNDSW